MEVQTYDIAGVTLLTPRHIGDERGYFTETFRADLFAKHIGDYRFVQAMNRAAPASARFAAFIFRGSRTPRASWCAAPPARCSTSPSTSVRDRPPMVSGSAKRSPPTMASSSGGAAGLCPWLLLARARHRHLLQGDGQLLQRRMRQGLAWNDPAIGIQWPDVADPDSLSAKDRKQPLLADLPAYFSWSN